MLVLTRRISERIIIGDNIRLTLLDTRGSTATIAVASPARIAHTIQVGQVIDINPDIWVQLLRVNGRQISIGIQAPREIPIHREEVAKRVAAEEAAIRARRFSAKAS